jgi:prolipoprotein diacylglyceryltransferase
MEFTLLWAALSGAGALYGALWWMSKRDTTLCVRDLWDIAIAAGIVGLVVGRLVAMMRGGVNPVAHPGDMLLVRAGVDTAAASLCALASAVWLARGDPGDQLDGMAPAVLIGLAGWHAGCIFRSACLGTPSSLPWAWAQTPGGVTRHPVELYTALLLVAAGIILFRVRLRYPPAFVVAGLGLASAGAARLLTEPLRPALFAGPVWWYGAALAVGLAVALWRGTSGRNRSAPDTTPLQ